MAHAKKVLTRTHSAPTVGASRTISGPKGLAKTKGKHMQIDKAPAAKDTKETTKNGAKAADSKPDLKPETAPQGSQTSAEQEETEETKGRRGANPLMPSAIIYKLGGKVYAAVHHPLDGSSYIESGKGEGSAKGALEDSGFRLSGVSKEGHDWIVERMPEGAELIGFASIKSFPLPKQG